MKVKVIGGNLVYRGVVYQKGQSMEIQDGEYHSLRKFVSDCDCGCGKHKPVETQELSIETQEVVKKKGRKGKKGCKNC